MANISVTAPLKVIFLDFDGVLNSAASFRYEHRRKTRVINETLSVIATSNLQYVLEQDSSVKIVVSSTWRKIFRLDKLKNILNSYGVDPSKVIGVTPSIFSGNRGREIRMWLDEHPNVEQYVILDDDNDAFGALSLADGTTDPKGHFFQTTWQDGLLFKQSDLIAKLFRGEKVTA